MELFKIRLEDAPALSNIISEDAIANIDQDGYYTIGLIGDEDYVCGCLQFHVGYSIINDNVCATITYLFVQEEFRREDVATILVDEFKNLLRLAGIADGIIEFMEGENSSDLINFFVENNFEFGQLQSDVYLINVEQLINSQYLKKVDLCHSICDLSNFEFKNITKRIFRQDTPLNIIDFDKDCSTYYKLKDGEGILLVNQISKGIIDLEMMGVSNKKYSSLQLALLYSTAEKVRELYGSRTRIRIKCTEEKYKKLISYIFPDIEPQKQNKGIVTII